MRPGRYVVKYLAELLYDLFTDPVSPHPVSCVSYEQEFIHRISHTLNPDPAVTTSWLLCSSEAKVHDSVSEQKHRTYRAQNRI